MKKVLSALLIVGVVLAFVIFAIGSGSSDGGSEIEDGGKVDKEQAEEKISIDEQVVFDHDGFVVTAKEYVNDVIWGDGIKLLIENNTADDITLTCDAVIVNDYMISDLFVETVASGKKSNSTLYLSTSDLEAAGITNVGRVEIYFRTYDPETYDTIYTADRVIVETSAVDSIDSSADNVGTELYNGNGIKIVGKYVDEESFWGAGVLLYIENNTAENITIGVDNLSVNGYMIESLFYSEVFSGKKAVDEITLFSSDLEENNIESIENIEFTFKVHNDDYEYIIDGEKIEIKL